MSPLPYFFSVRITPTILLPIHVYPSLKQAQQENIDSWFTEERKLELHQMLKPFLSEHLFERFTLHESQQNKKKKRISTSSIDLEDEEDEEGGFDVQEYDDQNEEQESKEYIAMLEFLKEEVSTDRTMKLIKGKSVQFSFQFTHTSPHYSLIQRTSTLNNNTSSVSEFFAPNSQASDSQTTTTATETSKWKPLYRKYTISKYTLKIYLEDLDNSNPNAKNITNYFSKK